MYSEKSSNPNSKNFDMRDEITKAAEILFNGGVVAAPTETVYGLLADATSISAIDKVRMLKGKPKDSPIPLFVPPSAELSRLLSPVPTVLNAIERNFLPGPLLVVAKPSKMLTNLPVCIGDKIGIRKSSAPVINKLLKQTGMFLTATSANRHGQKPAISALQIIESFKTTELYVIDNDSKTELSGKPSTVIEVKEGEIIILRQGDISASEIERAVGNYDMKIRIC
ncbi:MAG: hypothetical protein GF315_10820 [candidate division Zixibacteria bacterium]|nr:hypothetical protein [candidate division Zixibacteria bacterium]